MPSDCISFQSSGYFTPIIVDYLNQEEKLTPLYNHFPTLENFGKQIQQKSQNYPSDNREVLVDVLLEQYQNFEISELTHSNITDLRSDKTFTITTGHQLNLFSGPLYYLYKIVSTIKLTQSLKEKYPQSNFVPIFWMATEDHDFEEINHFHFKEKKIAWNREKAGPTGRISTESLDEISNLFKSELGIGTNAEYLANLFESAYINHKNLSDATRFLTNEIFGKYGIVIIDADDSRLKRLFIPSMKTDLLQNTAFEKVSETIKDLEDYTIQVNPREINLFYIEDDFRERIIKTDGIYHVNNTEIEFTKDEILNELENYPEKFSPNVIMRPLYQEVILPNLCYIGGGGELAYWFELKSYFESENITFPMLLLRNSVLLASEKQSGKLDKLGLSWKDIFSKQEDLLSQYTERISEIPIDFSTQRATLNKQFLDLLIVADQTDKSFRGAVLAQEAKQLKGLDNLEKRLLKAQKRKHSDELDRITILQNELFPFGSLQERRFNFAQFYLEYGDDLVTKLMNQLDPLSNEFDIVIL